jgi:proline iminopeptidase
VAPLVDDSFLHPPQAARRQGHLPVGDGHVLYWEESGAADGLPVVYLHGGPGAGCAPAYRRFFDPARYRVILFDQRGAGRSTPYASVEANTTAHLVADLESLRRHLGIDRWLLFGGSWGATLALAYGQAHPEAALGFILRGVFLFRRHEVEWFLHGMGRFFPEARRRYVEALPPGERETLLDSYYTRLCDADPAVHGPAARAWVAYEDACSKLLPRETDDRGGSSGGGGGPANLAMARIEAHYMRHGGFLDEGALLAGVDRVRHLPCAVVQGRYDMICPPATAMDLHRAWPGSRLTVVAEAGHSALEPGIRAALVAAADAFARDHG